MLREAVRQCRRTTSAVDRLEGGVGDQQLVDAHQLLVTSVLYSCHCVPRCGESVPIPLRLDADIRDRKRPASDPQVRRCGDRDEEHQPREEAQRHGSNQE
jgi:hypothetical protein